MKVILIISLLFAAFGCTQSTTEDNQRVTADELKKEAKDLVKAANTYTTEELQGLRDNFEENIKSLRDDLSALRTKMQKAGSAKQAQLKKQVEEIESEIAAVEKKAGEYRNAGEEAWADIKLGMDKARMHLDAALENAEQEISDVSQKR